MKSSPITTEILVKILEDKPLTFPQIIEKLRYLAVYYRNYNTFTSSVMYQLNKLREMNIIEISEERAKAKTRGSRVYSLNPSQQGNTIMEKVHQRLYGIDL